MKRALAFVLVFIMILGLVPAVYAAETELTGLSVNGLSVSHSETMAWDYDGFRDEAGDIVWEGNGSHIVAGLTPNDVDQIGAKLTFTNVLEVSATLRFEYSITNESEYDARVFDAEGNTVAYNFEKELGAGESYTISVISHVPDDQYFAPGTTTTLEIKNITLSTGNATVTFTPAENGSYTVDGVAITEEISNAVSSGTEYNVAATPAEGYQFFGWYNGSEYISHKAEAVITASGNATIYPVFIADTVSVFRVGERRFQDLAAADTYAKNSPVKTIVLMNDAVISGEYTISVGNTLLIPYDDADSVHTEATSIAVKLSDSLWENKAWEEPRAYRTLTMTEGSKLTIKGSLNVGGRHSSGPFLTAGSPSGDLGMIEMKEGANITVANGGKLYCWGYIYGGGTVTVQDGGEAHENFQFTDFRGGNYTLGLATSFLVFPMSQYYVQNIEVPTTFMYGATEYVWGSIYLQEKVLSTSVKFIGNSGISMFKPGVGGCVTKTYDPNTDRLVIDVYGGGSIDPMGLELGGTAIDTQTFVLPINSNMTININSGTTYLNQSLALLPGSELNITKSATLNIKSAEPLKNEDGEYVHYTGSNNLIVYDKDQWYRAYNENMEPVDVKFVYTSPGGLKRLQPVKYSPSRGESFRTEASLVDAVVDINGLLITDGFIYTTVDMDLIEFATSGNIVISGGGAAVISSGGTGNLVMNSGYGCDIITMQPLQKSDTIEYAFIPMVSAQLLNGDGSYLTTIGSAPATQYKYCAVCGNWYFYEESKPHTLEITWSVDGVVAPQEVCIGAKPVYNSGVDPEKTGYKFIGWSTNEDNVPEYDTTAELPEVTTEAIYFACFEEEAQGMLGDFDNSNEVDAADLTLLARHVAGIEHLTGQALENADVDGDGDISAEDLTTHARYVAGIIKEWPVN